MCNNLLEIAFTWLPRLIPVFYWKEQLGLERNGTERRRAPSVQVWQSAEFL